MPEGQEWCHQCGRQYHPSPLQFWSYSMDIPLRDLPALAGVSKPTVMRAARGIPIQRRSAEKLSRVTDIPIEVFIVKRKAV